MHYVRTYVRTQVVVMCLLFLTPLTGMLPQCPTPDAKVGENSTALQCNNGTATCSNGVSYRASTPRAPGCTVLGQGYSCITAPYSLVRTYARAYLPTSHPPFPISTDTALICTPFPLHHIHPGSSPSLPLSPVSYTHLTLPTNREV